MFIRYGEESVNSHLLELRIFCVQIKPLKQCLKMNYTKEKSEM